MNPSNLGNFAKFLKKLTVSELVVLRRDAIRERDQQAQAVIDEEFRRREKTKDAPRG